jgi:hypothetical protein
MNNHFQAGVVLRNNIKDLIFDFIKHSRECKPNAIGLKQTVIFRECGMDWGNKEKAKSNNQQYWVNAILRQLEEEGLIQQDIKSNQWRLSN